MIHPVPSRRHVVADDLRNQIATGRIKAGERLPSEAELASRYAVSTPTLRSALAVLQGEGLVEKIHGKGNFVRSPLRRVTYLGGGRLSSVRTMADAALEVTIRATSLRAQGDLVALLKVSASSPLTEFRCLSHDGESPHSLARIYVPRDLAPVDVSSPSPWCEGTEAELTAFCPRLAYVQETVSARLPTPEEAATLRISSALAVLAITRIAADITGRVIEAALLVFPGDRANAVFKTHHMTEERGTEG
ncbi:GntR family transcriptional regulator [Streptomyces sp. NPDC003023]|uniref:GntR family transcriptional regulator n=1 Tax=Streptomyces sp. NPDC003023 TaxID=3364675 RepID=UPI0036CC38D9